MKRKPAQYLVSETFQSGNERERKAAIRRILDGYLAEKLSGEAGLLSSSDPADEPGHP